MPLLSSRSSSHHQTQKATSSYLSYSHSFRTLKPAMSSSTIRGVTRLTKVVARSRGTIGMAGEVVYGCGNREAVELGVPVSGVHLGYC